ncbi:hypothetical protein [Notoacmeibacter ruber]|uniref:DUF4258 domain-containing protein n=1 Tax=Notoacmeibacter ruber TaxID=2670375 RepID=A0A3L7JEZ0_9HYPH|nr:hypothetical protein [Notoacmeibacter ruber]RLQ88895.1 hypothetical protein D8780_12330 [Notoacmeibacter ruber]
MTRRRVHVTDHAVLRYLERAHGLDVEAVRNHLAGLAGNGARLGATAVIVEKVKLVLIQSNGTTLMPTVLRPRWPVRRPRDG